MGFGKLLLWSWGCVLNGSVQTQVCCVICKSKAWTGADTETPGLFLTLFAHAVKVLNLILKHMIVSANDGKLKKTYR